ncbi:MAG: cyclic nucleotide-binding domain-containing protein [Bacteroidota bacterium]
MTEIKAYLDSIYELDDDLLRHYLSFWSDYTAPRKAVVTAPGEVEHYLYFVLEGVQKLYYMDDVKQHVLAFSYPPSFSGVIESFFTQTASRYYLETVTKTRCLRIAWQDHQRLMDEYRDIERLFRKLTERFILGMMQRHHELMAFDMETRFRTFVARSPHLLGMVPQKDLASYLRMDATNFSKLINSVRI